MKGLQLAYVGRWITPVDGGTLFRSYLRHDLISFYRSCVERGKHVGFTNPDFDSSGSVIYRHHHTYLLTYLAEKYGTTHETVQFIIFRKLIFSGAAGVLLAVREEQTHLSGCGYIRFKPFRLTH